MTNYIKGRAFEYRVRRFLEAHGWKVFRMAGSKTKADLIAYSGRGKAYFVQCKAKGSFGSKERKEFLSLAESCGAFPLFSCAPKGRLEFYFAGESKSHDAPFDILSIEKFRGHRHDG